MQAPFFLAALGKRGQPDARLQLLRGFLAVDHQHQGTVHSDQVELDHLFVIGEKEDSGHDKA